MQMQFRLRCYLTARQDTKPVHIYFIQSEQASKQDCLRFNKTATAIGSVTLLQATIVADYNLGKAFDQLLSYYRNKVAA